jgi:hypothetical protein
MDPIEQPAEVPPPEQPAPPNPVNITDGAGNLYTVDASELRGFVRDGYQIAGDGDQPEPGRGIPLERAGKLEFLPPEQATEALATDWSVKPSTFGAVDQAEEQRRWTSPLQQARAASAGWLRGIPGSDAILTSIDPTLAPELDKLQRYNPGLSAGAEMAGMAAPFLLGGGVARAAGMLGEGGALAGRAAAGAVGAAEGGWAARAAGAVGRGAMDFGAYEASSEVNRAARAQEPISAEKVALAFGHGALLGGALGGAGSLAWSGAKGAAGAAASKASEIGQRQLEKWEASGGREAFGREQLLRSTGAGEEVAARYQAAAPELQDRARKILLDEVPEFAQGKALRTVGENAKTLGVIVERNGERVAQLEARAIEAGEAPQLARVAEEFRAAKGLGAKGASAELREVEKVLGQVEKAGTDPAALRELQATLAKPGASEAATALRGELRAAVEAEVGRAAQAAEAKLGPEWAGSLQSARAELEAAQLARDLVADGAKAAGAQRSIWRGGLETGAQVLSAGPVAAAATLAGAVAQQGWSRYGRETVARVALGRETVASTARAIGQAVDAAVGGFFTKAAPAARAVGGVAREGAARVAAGGQAALPSAVAALGGERPAAPAPTPAPARKPTPAPAKPPPDFDNVRMAIAASREQTAQRYAELAALMPAMAADFQAAAASSERAYAYLASKLPQPSAAKYSLTPQLVKVQPSKTEQEAFMVAARVVANPLSVLDSLKSGTLQRAEVEALAATSPELYQEIRGAVQVRLDGLSSPLPYRQELQLSTLLGVVGSPALDPAVHKAVQAAYAAGGQAGGAQASPQASPATPTAPRRPVRARSDWSLDKEAA